MSSPIRVRQFSNVTMLSSFERAGCDAPKERGSRLVGQTSDGLNDGTQPVEAEASVLHHGEERLGYRAGAVSFNKGFRRQGARAAW